MAGPGVGDARRAAQRAHEEGLPTPRWAAELLIADAAAELEVAQHRLWALALFQNHGLPHWHPDRLSTRDISRLVGLHKSNVYRRLEAFADEHPELRPRYTSIDQGAAVAPRTGPGAAAVQPGQREPA